MTNAPRSRLTLWPGAPGTKEAVATYEEVPWPPADGTSVDVRIDPEHARLRAAVEQHGATRRRDEIWSVPRRVVHGLGIAAHVIQRPGGRRGG